MSLMRRIGHPSINLVPLDLVIKVVQTLMGRSGHPSKLQPFKWHQAPTLDAKGSRRVRGMKRRKDARETEAKETERVKQPAR
jgi:hypothetical protein